MPSALPVGRAVPYDAYSPDHLHDRPPPPPSSHPPHQHHHQQPAAVAAGGGSPSVRQRWYELSDGAVTPPDDSSSSSHRGDLVSHVTAALPLPHAVTASKRRPLGCRLAASVCIDVLLVASLAVSAYFLRLRHLLGLPTPRVGGVMLLCRSVCLSACEQDNSKSYVISGLSQNSGTGWVMDQRILC